MSTPDEKSSVARAGITGHGAGADMRIAPIRWNGLTRGGARFIVRTDPASALGAAVSRLRDQGLAVGDATFQDALRRSGSEWLAQDLRLGEVRKSWKRGIIADLIEDTGLEFFPRFWRGATPTLVVASARAAPDGAEVVVFPHLSMLGGSDRNDSGPLVRKALAALDEEFTRAGVLVSRETLRAIKNDGSPASQKVVRDLLGWR